MKRRARVRARQELRFAQTLDEEHQNYAGLARTHELIGDLHRPRADRRNAALTEYGLSAQNYVLADLQREARAVRQKINELMGDGGIADGVWTRSLDRGARWFLRLAEKQRVRARTKAA
jgi:hypothetical protein